MDALIRLDVLLPIAPNENTLNRNESTTDNPLILHRPEALTNNEPTINVDDGPDIIDLTPLHVEGSSNHGGDEAKPMATKAVPFTYPQLIIVDEDEPSSVKHQTSKHKLLVSTDHSPAKVPRTASGTENHSRIRPTPEHFRNRPIIPSSSIMSNHTVTSADLSKSISEPNRPNFTLPGVMKNHTVTSTDVNNAVICQAGTSNSFRPSQNDVITSKPSCEPPLPLKQGPPNDFQNNKFTQQIYQGDNEPSSICVNQMPQEVNEIESDNILDRDMNENELTIFYQLVDMFPDIDLEFLGRQCRLGLNINEVIEIILGMNDYPKLGLKISKSTFVSTIGETSVCVKNQDNSTSFSSNIKPRPIMLNCVADLGNEGIKNDNLSPKAVPDTTSLLGPTLNKEVTPLINPVSKISEIKEVGVSESVVRPTSSNSEIFNEYLAVKGLITRLESEKEKDNVLGERNHTESHLDFLLAIFPDADPIFLETKSKLNKNDLRDFITESMEKKDYPKKAASMKVEKEKDEPDEIGLYTSNFNLERFIKIFPDPFGYFLDEKRNCQPTEHGLEFLKRRYRNHALKIISSKYNHFKFNLVKTCEFLDGEKFSRSTKRGLQEIRMPNTTNLPFLQEACFIEHKDEIKKHLDGIAEAKRLAYEQAEARGELIECGCCYQDVLFEECATCDEGHLFCKTCVQKSVEVRIGDGLTTFPCLQDCDSIFSLQSLEALVDATMFSRLLQRIQLDEVKAADIEGLEVCPFCDFAIILPPETNIFQCLNPECLKESCRKCHRLSHIPQRCEELENDDQARARKFIEDEMTRALVRECYKCKKSFIKTDGCNKMTCTCGAKMCYICRAPITDYTHFNGPNGDQTNKCPLYSTDKVLHVDAVEAVAKKALEEVTSKNPELKLKHDPTKILPPAQSANTTLPPGVNENVAQLLNVLQNPMNERDRLAAAERVIQRPVVHIIDPNRVNNRLENFRERHHYNMNQLEQFDIEMQIRARNAGLLPQAVVPVQRIDLAQIYENPAAVQIHVNQAPVGVRANHAQNYQRGALNLARQRQDHRRPQNNLGYPPIPPHQHNPHNPHHPQR